MLRSSHPEMFLGKGVLKKCTKFTGENPRRNAISRKLQNNFIEIALWYGCSPVNLRHIFRTPFLKNTCGRLLLRCNINNLVFWISRVMAVGPTHPCCHQKRTVINVKYGIFAVAGNIIDFQFCNKKPSSDQKQSPGGIL